MNKGFRMGTFKKMGTFLGTIMGTLNKFKVCLKVCLQMLKFYQISRILNFMKKINN